MELDQHSLPYLFKKEGKEGGKRGACAISVIKKDGVLERTVLTARRCLIPLR